jgi:hypothetical protein
MIVVPGPTHLEVAGQALLVGRVEHQLHAVGGELLEPLEGETGEDAPSLVVGIRGGVDRPNGLHHGAAGEEELPAQERAEADHALAVERDPHRRHAVRVLEVLPGEEGRIVVVPAQRTARQLDDPREVSGIGAPDGEVVAGHGDPDRRVTCEG